MECFDGAKKQGSTVPQTHLSKYDFRKYSDFIKFWPHSLPKTYLSALCVVQKNLPSHQASKNHYVTCNNGLIYWQGGNGYEYPT